jgi:hypothetical protein
MTQKTFWIIIVSITVLFWVLVANTYANEIVPEKKPLTMQVQGKLLKWWEDTKQFQLQNWQQGKDQLARNKQQIISLFQKN